MSDNNVVEIGPKVSHRSESKRQVPEPEAIELKDIFGARTYAAIVAGAQLGFSMWDARERRKFRRFLLLIACGLVVSLIGAIRLAIILMQH